MNRPIALLILLVSAVTTGAADADADKKLVTLVEKHFGKVERDEDQPGKPITYVELGSSEDLTDADLKVIAQVKTIQVLSLYKTKVTDAGLKELASLTALTTLTLDDTKVTDAGLKHLAPLQKLTELKLSKTKVTDEAFKELVALKSLETVFMSETKVTDAGVAKFEKALPKCKVAR